MRKSLALAVGAAVVACSAVSMKAAANEGMYLGPTINYLYTDEKRSESRDDFYSSGLVGLNWGHRFHNDWALELSGATDIVGADIDAYQLNAYFWIGDEEENRYNWRPYVLAGISHFDIGEDSVRTDADNEFDNSWQVQAGFGMSKLFENDWEIRIDGRFYHKIREGQDGTNDLGANLAFIKYFNPAPAPLPPVVEAAPEPEPYVQPEPVEPETRTITVRLNVEFEFDKAVVRAIYGDELEAIASAMKVHEDIDLVLEGHTDSIGSDDYNQGLSERRANAVKAALSDTYGIPADRISAVGYGESRPIDTNDTDEGRQRNRRVIGEMSYTEVVPE